MLGRVLLIIAIILLIVMVVLYFLGKKAQKKKEEQDAQVAAAAQSVSMLIIDKKRMRLKDAGLPQQVLAQTNKLMQRSKLPVVCILPVYVVFAVHWKSLRASRKRVFVQSFRHSTTKQTRSFRKKNRRNKVQKNCRNVAVLFISFRVCEILCFAVDLPSGEYGSLQHAHC